MSVDSARKWLEMLRENKELAKKAKAITDFIPWQKMAAEHGFEFNENELHEAAKSLTDELSDDDLDLISGGEDLTKNPLCEDPRYRTIGNSVAMAYANAVY
ncbi:Nif11-like leader peptide family natural product precursor [Desulfovibrio sp. JC010]|uniref:Nif11-like leader peptide family natural product precursor n=1 Tax=Desulfovibrio sp. JC010 TaxID=2593641 RepID=UPI0013CFF41B|nr:Nif11-like leader peptide family natural product precursor [Desulfovibrio sp. JC010]NDV27683.1 Nif11-like leader peptide family natural product precursor [Desulfovibrio sp. JC010]